MGEVRTDWPGSGDHFVTIQVPTTHPRHGVWGTSTSVGRLVGDVQRQQLLDAMRDGTEQEVPYTPTFGAASGPGPALKPGTASDVQPWTWPPRLMPTCQAGTPAPSH